MIIDERCGICESGARKDAEHLLVMCGNLREIGGYWWMR